MNRAIKFRGKRVDNGEWVYGYYLTMPRPSLNEKYNGEKHFICECQDPVAIKPIEVLPNTIGQYSGLKDKNGVELYEEDVINKEGVVIGNVYEIDKGKTDLVIQGFGTKNWITTYKEAMVRGCQDSE